MVEVNALGDMGSFSHGELGDQVTLVRCGCSVLKLHERAVIRINDITQPLWSPVYPKCFNIVSRVQLAPTLTRHLLWSRTFQVWFLNHVPVLSFVWFRRSLFCVNTPLLSWRLPGGGRLRCVCVVWHWEAESRTLGEKPTQSPVHVSWFPLVTSVEETWAEMLWKLIRLRFLQNACLTEAHAASAD